MFISKLCYKPNEKCTLDAPVPKRRRVTVPDPVGVEAAMGLPAAEWDADLDFAPNFGQGARLLSYMIY
jgi:hypothetical protein